MWLSKGKYFKYSVKYDGALECKTIHAHLLRTTEAWLKKIYIVKALATKMNIVLTKYYRIIKKPQLTKSLWDV